MEIRLEQYLINYLGLVWIFLYHFALFMLDGANKKY